MKPPYHPFCFTYTGWVPTAAKVWATRSGCVELSIAFTVEGLAVKWEEDG
jgi:hypothetical protein